MNRQTSTISTSNVMSSSLSQMYKLISENAHRSSKLIEQKFESISENSRNLISSLNKKKTNKINDFCLKDQLLAQSYNSRLKLDDKTSVLKMKDEMLKTFSQSDLDDKEQQISNKPRFYLDDREKQFYKQTKTVQNQDCTLILLGNEITIRFKTQKIYDAFNDEKFSTKLQQMMAKNEIKAKVLTSRKIQTSKVCLLCGDDDRQHKCQLKGGFLEKVFQVCNYVGCAVYGATVSLLCWLANSLKLFLQMIAGLIVQGIGYCVVGVGKAMQNQAWNDLKNQCIIM